MHAFLRRRSRASSVGAGDRQKTTHPRPPSPRPLTGTINGYAYSAKWATVSGSTSESLPPGSSATVFVNTLLPDRHAADRSPPVFGVAAIFRQQATFDGHRRRHHHLAAKLHQRRWQRLASTAHLTYAAARPNTQQASTGTSPTAPSRDSTLAAPSAATFIAQGRATKPPTAAKPGPNKTFRLHAIADHQTVVIYVQTARLTQSHLHRFRAPTLYRSRRPSPSAPYGTSTKNPVKLVTAGSRHQLQKHFPIYGSLLRRRSVERRRRSTGTGLMYVRRRIRPAPKTRATSSIRNQTNQNTAPWFDPAPAAASGGRHHIFHYFAATAVKHLHSAVSPPIRGKLPNSFVPFAAPAVIIGTIRIGSDDNALCVWRACVACGRLAACDLPALRSLFAAGASSPGGRHHSSNRAESNHRQQFPDQDDFFAPAKRAPSRRVNRVSERQRPDLARGEQRKDGDGFGPKTRCQVAAFNGKPEIASLLLATTRKWKSKDAQYPTRAAPSAGDLKPQPDMDEVGHSPIHAKLKTGNSKAPRDGIGRTPSQVTDSPERKTGRIIARSSCCLSEPA